MAELVIRGGTVLTARGPERLDVRVAEGRIAELGPALSGPRELDAGGCWVGPGLVDLHCHTREPGQEWKEDLQTACLAAAAGGYTAILAMPNTDPPVDRGVVARQVVQRGEQIGLVEVAAAGALTAGRLGERLSHLDELWEAGVRVFTDDGDTVTDSGVLRRAMEYLAVRGGVVAQHAEDPALSAGGHLHEGSVSSRLGVAGIPREAEEVVVGRDLHLVRLTGCRYHVQHVSSRGTVELVEAARHSGLPVTAEVTPHHLAFDETAVEDLNPDFKMYPPLRTAEDRTALREALDRGTIDVVATDHAPHARQEKEVPFEEAPRGVIGLETALSVTLGVIRDPKLVFDRMAVRPARIAGMPSQGRVPEVGSPANLVVVDPDRRWTPTTFRSKSGNSPWKGVELVGRARFTLYRGRVTWEDS